MIINAAGRRVDEITGDGREGCGFGPCLASRERGGRGCTLCDVIAKLPQPGNLARQADAAAAVAPVLEAEGLDLLPPAPTPLELEPVRAQQNPTRDGAPKLSGERERRHPMFEKRRRDGPHRSNV